MKLVTTTLSLSDIIYEDEDIIIINKPAGLLSQPSVDKKRFHVVQALQELYPKQKFYLHHRLDKETSGVLLLSKTERVNKKLTYMFQEHKFTKTYKCLCINNNIQPENILKNTILSENFLIKNHVAPVKKHGSSQLQRMVIVKNGGWPAETHVSFIEKIKNFYLFRCQPKTGRTHQIRLHMASYKFPIAGDFLYGGKSSLVTRMCLHAEKLEFNHPLTNQLLSASCPIDFLKLLN